MNNPFDTFTADEQSVIARALETYHSDMLGTASVQRPANRAAADNCLSRARIAGRLQREADKAHARSARNARRAARRVEEEDEQEERLTREGLRFVVYDTRTSTHREEFRDFNDLTEDLSFKAPETLDDFLVLVETFQLVQDPGTKSTTSMWMTDWEVPARRLMALLDDEMLNPRECLSSSPPHVIDRTSVHA